MAERHPDRPRLAVLGAYLRFLPGLRGWYLASVVLAVLTAAATLGLLALSGWFISAAALAGLSPVTALAFNFFMPGAGVRALAIVRTTARWGERVLTHEATFRMLASVRVWLFGRLLTLSPRQVGAFHGAELLHRFMCDVEQLDGLLPRLLLPAFAFMVVLLTGAGLLSAWGIVAGWPALVLLAFVGLLFPASWMLARDYGTTSVERRAGLRRAMIDAADGVGVLAFNAHAWQTCRARALERSGEALQAQARSDRLAAWLRALVIVAIGWLAWWVMMRYAGVLDGPRLVAMVLLLLGVAEIAAPLATGLVDLPAISHAAGRIERLAGQRPAIVAPVRGAVPVDGSLSVERVSFAWDAHTPVLSHCSLAVAEGEHVLLRGPSGCGKSSLVQLLARFELPAHGRIVLGGIPLDEIDEPTLRTTLAVASQFVWARGATLVDNLRLANPAATVDDIWAVLEVVGLAATVQAWPEGLQTWVQEGGLSLSGGQLRRLGVARALLRRAPLTVLDEPTEGLDETAAAQLAEAVSAWLRGRTLVWISHRTEGLAGFSRRIEFAGMGGPCGPDGR